MHFKEFSIHQNFNKVQNTALLGILCLKLSLIKFYHILPYRLSSGIFSLGISSSDEKEYSEAAVVSLKKTKKIFQTLRRIYVCW